MSYDNSPPPSRVRVPPPPPPGFGDEEYYRLYGRPEEYHRYRERLERNNQDDRNYSHSDRPLPPRPAYLHDVPPGRPPRRAPPPPGHDHEEYYYYRSYRRPSERNNFDYDDPELDSFSSNGAKVRRAPPPPAHRSPDATSPFYESNIITDCEEDIDDLESRAHEMHTKDEGNRDFENFRVTIKNAHNRRHRNSEKAKRKGRAKSVEGTPSLSGIDDEELDEEDEDSYYDDTIDEDSEDEESKQRRQRHRRGGEEYISNEKRTPPLKKHSSEKRGSIKDRLGSRIPARPPSPVEPPVKRSRVTAPSSPSNKRHIGAKRSSENQNSKRPPSPLSPPPEDENIDIESDDDVQVEEPRKSIKRSLNSRISRRENNLSNIKRKPARPQDQSNTSKTPASPDRRDRKKNARSWSKENDNLGSRYGNRSPTPLPGTPRRVREQRAREAAAKKVKGSNEKTKSHKGNPIYGKSKMRMDTELKQSKTSRDGSSDENQERKGRSNNRNERSRGRRSQRNDSRDGASRSSSRKEKSDQRNRSRTSSGGFGKGVIGRNRNRNTSDNRRPPTPPPIGSKSRNKNVKSKGKPKATHSDEKQPPTKISRQNTDKTTRENEIMLRKLARKRKGIPKSSESDKNHTLAKMAGIEIPLDTSGMKSRNPIIKDEDTTKSKTASKQSKEKYRSSDCSNTDSDSGSGSGSPAQKGRKRDWKSGVGERNKSTKYVRATKERKSKKSSIKENMKRHKDSESDRNECRSRSRSMSSNDKSTPVLPTKKTGNSSGKWAHDKFQETLASPADERVGSANKPDDRSDFGSHWQKIRSERSKERERAGRSRSKSKTKRKKGRRSSSYSSRSSDDSRTHKRRRRTKKSRSSSRGSSYSSSRSPSTASSSSTGSIHRERRRERRKISRKDRLKISAENTSVAQAATRASQAILSRPQGSGSNLESQQVSESQINGAELETTVDKPAVNMGLSGKLLEESNTVNGVVVKYSEPVEARKPKTRWRLYVFKGNEELPILYIHRQSAYLLGRDRKVRKYLSYVNYIL